MGKTLQLPNIFSSMLFFAMNKVYSSLYKLVSYPLELMYLGKFGTLETGIKEERSQGLASSFVTSSTDEGMVVINRRNEI